MNYPNMSYCMCENTLHALQQVLEAMQEDPAFMEDMSRDERYAFQELFCACEDFAHHAREHLFEEA